MGQFDWAIELAQQLIAENGEAVTLVKETPGAEDPAQPWKPAVNTPVPYPGLSMVFLNYNDQNRQPKTYADGTQTQIGDKEVYLAAGPGVPEPVMSDYIIRGDGTKWTVKASAPLDPNGQVIIYTLWVRQ